MQGNVDEAVDHVRAILRRFDEINNRLGEVTDPKEMEKLLGEQVRVQDEIEMHNAWELDRQIEIAMDAMNLPPGDADVRSFPAASGAAWRCAKSCWKSPTCCCWMNPRTILTPKA